METIPTTYMIFNLDIVTYKKLPTIDWYKVLSTGVDSTSLLNLHLVIIGVALGLQSSILNLLNISFTYLCCEIKIPLFVWTIYNPEKKDNSPNIDISNSYFIAFWKCLHISSLLPPEIIFINIDHNNQYFFSFCFDVQISNHAISPESLLLQVSI